LPGRLLGCWQPGCWVAGNRRQPSNPATVGNRFSTVGAFWHLAATDDFAVKIGARAAELRQLTRPLNAPPVAAAEPVFCPRGLFAAASTTPCRCVSLASGTEIVWLRMPSELYLPFGGSKVLSPPPCCDLSNAQTRTSLENQKVPKGAQRPIREKSYCTLSQNGYGGGKPAYSSFWQDDATPDGAKARWRWPTPFGEGWEARGSTYKGRLVGKVA